MYEDKIKKLKMLDIALIKLAVLAFAFFIITVPNTTNNVIMSWVSSVHWGWFLGIAIVLAAIVQIRIRK